ncbi:MAG: CocE/NonD family hydrolase [Planctomycetaceae bacterium]|nr:CocE/NonD family hydrolase [Planctomycetaceae bacterium]
MHRRLFLLVSLLSLAGSARAQDILEESAMIPMRDGVRLSAVIYRPAGDGRWPVLLEQRYANGNGPAVREQFSKLARSGYAVVLANFRGSQMSEGLWQGYRALGWGELKDGYDLVEWLAGQPWSTGKVGTFGSSQAGFAQNFLAVTRPPHLTAQYMIDTGLSLYHEGYRIGGATKPQRFLELAKICREPAHNNALLAEWFRHPTFDDYWAAEDCSQHFDQMNVPCFTIGSWYDFMCVGSVDSYIGRQHRGGPQSRGQQQLLLGPWLHGRVKEINVTGEMTYPERAKFPLDAHMVRWFDHYLKGIENGVEREPTIRYFVMGAVGEEHAPGNEWRTATDWPIAARPTAHYLHTGGRLTGQPPESDSAAMTFQADPEHPASIPGRAFPGAKDASDFERQPNVLTFTTDVLTEPVEWTGKVVAEMFLASDCPDTDLIVRISDVYPDGRSMLIMDYIRRVRYREGYEREVFLEPGKVVPVTLDVGWLSLIFAKGHRIRVTVASTGAPFYESNPNTGLPLTVSPPDKVRVATNQLQVNRKHASRILSPVISP